MNLLRSFFVNIITGKGGDSLVLAFVRVVTILIGIAITSILSHGLDLNTYGIYSQGNLLVSTLTSISILGFTDGTNYFYNKRISEEKKIQYINTLFSIQLIIGLVLAISVIFFQDLIFFYFKSDAIQPFLIYICLRPMLNNFLPMLQVLYVSNGKAKIIAARNFLISVAKVVGVIITVYVTYDLASIFAVLFLMDLISVVYFWIDFSRYDFLIKPWKLSMRLLGEIFSFCLPMGVYIMLNSLCRECDKLVISRLGNSEELAIYSNSALPLPIDLIVSSVLTIIIPVITRLYNAGNYQGANEAFKSYLSIGYLSTFILGGACILLSKELILFLYGDKYLDGLPVFVIYLFVDILKFANVSLIMSISGKSKVLVKLSLALLCSNIVLNVVGYYIMGMVGPAISTLIVTLFSVVFLLVYGAKELHTSILKLFDLRIFFIFVFKMALVFALCVIFKSVLSIFSLPNFAVICSLGVIFISISFFANRKHILKTFFSINRMEG